MVSPWGSGPAGRGGGVKRHRVARYDGRRSCVEGREGEFFRVNMVSDVATAGLVCLVNSTVGVPGGACLYGLWAEGCGAGRGDF